MIMAVQELEIRDQVQVQSAGEEAPAQAAIVNAAGSVQGKASDASVTVEALLLRRFPQLQAVEYHYVQGRLRITVGSQVFRLYTGTFSPRAVYHAKAIAEINGREITLDAFVCIAGKEIRTYGVTPWNRSYELDLRKVQLLESQDGTEDEDALLTWLTTQG